MLSSAAGRSREVTLAGTLLASKFLDSWGVEFDQDGQGKPTSSRFGPCCMSAACRHELGRPHQHPYPHEIQESKRNSPHAPSDSSSGQKPHGESDASFCDHDAPPPALLRAFPHRSFAEDVSAGDITAGEDATVRQAAIDALGNMNGTVVAIEPTSGRVLAMVNQKLALSSGAQPCSTIKLSVALAALQRRLRLERNRSRPGPP